LEGNDDKTAILPQIEELEEVGSMRPPFYQKKKGRNQTARYQSGGHKHQAGATHGVKPPRKCSNCKLPGHNAATCNQPVQPAQGAPVDFSGAFGDVAGPYMM
jgi:hypothetical protein